MYQPLAPDPLPPGPRVTNPLAPLLALLLRLFNLALAAASLLAVGGALCMAEQYRQGGGGGGGDDPPPPAPEPAAPSNHAVAAAGAAVALASQATASWPWFIYCVGGAGAYGFATALCGLAGLKRGRRLQLGAYILLLALLILAEALATLLLLTDNAWRARIPDDPSGRWRQAQQWVGANARGARLGAVASLGAELAALAAACALHAIYQSAYEAWLDDREELTERSRERLDSVVYQLYSGGSGSSRRWSKYAINPSAVEAATNAARQTAALKDNAV